MDTKRGHEAEADKDGKNVDIEQDREENGMA
jgi:hypothetical protein